MTDRRYYSDERISAVLFSGVRTAPGGYYNMAGRSSRPIAESSETIETAQQTECVVFGSGSTYVMDTAEPLITSRDRIPSIHRSIRTS